ncbi:MAG: putative cytokinetic ring protein SteA [Solirubrobacterales bacterium]
MLLKGKARLDRRTKDLVKRLRKGDIAFIDHDDIDEVSAKSIIAVKPQAVVNAQASITGRYTTKGAQKILKAGIPIIDEVGPGFFDRIREGALVEIRDGEVWHTGSMVCSGRVLGMEHIEERLLMARENLKVELDRFVENTLEYARKEKDVLLDDMDLPPTSTEMENRPVLIVVRGKRYKEDLRAIKAYLEDENPIMIGVDGGADALLEFGYRPDMIVGDMDSVSDQALRCGAEIVVHAYANGKAPGLSRVESMGIDAVIVPMPGTSEDVAMIMAYQKGASLIVAVGTHSNMVDFLEKGRKGMASTFLIRLKVGSILVDAKGVSQLYRQSVKAKYLLQLFLASLIPIVILLWAAPSTKPLFSLVILQVRLLLNSL